MMRNLIIFVFLLGFSFTKAQKVYDFKYIEIPENLSDFEQNKYGLTNYLKLLLNRKEYTLLTSDKSNWPAEAKENPCKVLKVDLIKESSLFQNKLSVNFTDCNKNTIGEFEGKSKIKNFKRGYQEALMLAMKGLSDSNPQDLELYNPIKTTAKNKAPESGGHIGFDGPTDGVSKTPESGKHVGFDGPTDKKSEENSDRNQIFSDGETEVELTKLNDGTLLLINTKNDRVIFRMKPSTRKGVYQTTVQQEENNYETIGYFDGNTIEIEMPSQTKEAQLKIFRKK